MHLLRARLVALVVVPLFTACAPEVRDGYYACAAASECPDGFFCVGGRCSRSAGGIDSGPSVDAGSGGVDAGSTDVDASSEVDAGAVCPTDGCRDGDPCTRDECLAGVCVFTRDDMFCRDCSTVMCDAGTVCVAGSCVACGMDDGPCCPIGSAGTTACINPALGCSMGICQRCGGEAEPCCDSGCDSGFGCRTSVGVCEVCGGHGQVCCARPDSGMCGMGLLCTDVSGDRVCCDTSSGMGGRC